MAIGMLGRKVGMTQVFGERGEAISVTVLEAGPCHVLQLRSMERDGYAGGIYCYPSLDAPALDAGGQSLAQKIDGLLEGLPDYSDERDELSVALYGDVQILSLDQDGRITVPDFIREHTGIGMEVAFVGRGQFFQIWEPGRLAAYGAEARARLLKLRQGTKPGERPE